MADSVNSGAIVSGGDTSAKKNPTFEDALGGDNPYTSPAGTWPGMDKASKQWVWAAYQNIYGRAPTEEEMSIALPAAQSGTTGARAFVAQAHQTEQNTPDKLYAEQQKKYLADAPKFAGQVQDLFQGQFGRAASQDELNHFGSLLASGTTDSYQLQDFLKQQPEYQTKQNEQMRQGLTSTMAANDKRQFSEQILPSIQEAFAKQGRSFDSSAFANSATQSAQQQNTAREGFLNNLTASQYGGVQDRAYQDYANQVNNQQNLTNQGIQARYAGIQGLQQRSNDMQDYNMQQQAYNQYLAKYGKRGGNSITGGLMGAVSGATMGSKFGVWGALAGGAAGGGLGAWGASQGGNY